MPTYTWNVVRTISGTVKVDADNEDEAFDKATAGDFYDLQEEPNDKPMGLADWEINELIQIDGKDVEE